MDNVVAFVWGGLVGAAIMDFGWRRLSRKWANLAEMIAELKKTGATDER
ncbi:hypothetical protein [Sphingomonas sp. NIC1]|nr:hypothetical protein [Sphingomonas sp. NIC1]